MATKLLPAAKIGVKKKTISADLIRPNTLKKRKNHLRHQKNLLIERYFYE